MYFFHNESKSFIFLYVSGFFKSITSFWIFLTHGQISLRFLKQQIALSFPNNVGKKWKVPIWILNMEICENKTQDDYSILTAISHLQGIKKKSGKDN